MLSIKKDEFSKICCYFNEVSLCDLEEETLHIILKDLINFLFKFYPTITTFNNYQTIINDLNNAIKKNCKKKRQFHLKNCLDALIYNLMEI